MTASPTNIPAPTPPPTAPAVSSRRMNRVKSLCLLVPCVTLLAIATVLSPDPRGMGTHQKMGLPPCGFQVVTGMPCPTCGMTTSFSYAAHGHLIDSFINQPMGAVFAVMTAIFALLALFGLITGTSLRPVWDRLLTSRFMLIMGGLLIVAWIYKIFLVTGKP